MSITTHRIGARAAAAVMAIGLAYVVVLTAGMVRHGFEEPITDPILAVMEVLTLLSALPILLLVATMAERAPTEQRLAARIALAFATLFAGTTSAVHFVELTATRQAGGGGLVWPSTAYALELLAWDVFLGIALLSAAATLHPRGRERTARQALLFCGALCLVGTIGPLSGYMRLQLLGVFGYAVVLPIAAFLLWRLFSAEGSAAEAGGTSAG
ncbi:MAG: hypothetical protein SX243_15320 [Acidobacteriota bacterium]|nr:hypothetical protein [Acidobacteriota bacterium]